ncbi:MAG TPA: twin-arginine translocase TatA/TatE family subunit [Anaeromyxobacteraceae bacterium]|nr:twin-arginine translocase TatA/TatE family subunit [Anaeromyxobacteraceae bacterium]
MFGLGFGEIVVILVLALVLLGPQKLPEVAKQLGKGLRDFRKATDDLKGQFERELYADERPARPKIAPPTAAAPVAATAPQPVPAASVENVPGLDAALAEPVPAAPATPAAAPVPSPGASGPDAVSPGSAGTAPAASPAPPPGPGPGSPA